VYFNGDIPVSNQALRENAFKICKVSTVVYHGSPVQHLVWLNLSPPISRMEPSVAFDGYVYYREMGVKRLILPNLV
jgi:hypothetical protein